MKTSDSYNSRLPNLRNLSSSERLAKVLHATGLSDSDLAFLGEAPSLPMATAQGMIENVVGTFDLPIGIASNFKVNDKDYLIPMVVEEPSVVAGASFMAKLARTNGGFIAYATDPIMRGQIQLLRVADPHAAKQKLFEQKQQIIELANSKDKILIDLGGGCQDIEVEIFENTRIGPMVVLHLLVDVRDAMGANIVNTMVEAVAPLVGGITDGEPRLRILSNLADRRIVSARVSISPDTLATSEYTGDVVADGIVEACALAEIDPYRATTHNKGVMNGIDPVVLATGNDWRAVEAGAHAWAARSGRYTSLTRWERNAAGHLLGTIELPLAVGLVGGATKTHPSARAALKLMRIESATELAKVIAAVGLAQNMAALRALATEGIQRGHMALHARNIAIAAGATGSEIDRVATALASGGEVSSSRAKALLHDKN